MAKLLWELDKLKWNTESLILAQLLDKYSLPKLVKVTEGFYGESDDSTLCNGTILCLHSVQAGEKVHGRLSSGKGKDILIPLDCRTKVEVRPSNLKDVYKSVAELCMVFPKYVRVSQGCFSEHSGEVLVEVGDKLQLKGVNKSKKKQETLICFDQHRQKIELPKDTVAGFQPLVDGKEYYLSDVVKKFKMPLNVQFVGLEPSGIGEDPRSPNESPCQPFQAVSLDRISKETVVTATSIRTNGRHHLVQFSRDLNVGLSICDESFKSSEYYPNISKIFNLGKEKTETHAYEYIDPATIMNIRQTRVPKPAPNPPPKRPKPTISSKPKTKNKPTVDTQPNHIYEAIEEQQYSECQIVEKESAYTELDPTYVSTQKYGELIVQKPNPSKNDQPEIDTKPKLPEGAIALPIRLSAALKGKSGKPPVNERPEVSKSKPDFASKVEGLLPTPETKPQNASIHQRKNSPPPVPRRSRSYKTPPTLPPRPERSSAPPDSRPQRPDSPPESATVSSIQASDKSVVSRESNVTGERDREEIYQIIAKYPSDLSSLNVADVGRLLKYLGMEKHVETFTKEMIDGSMLGSLDRESLQSLEVNPFHAKKLLRFIGGWRPNV